jgi:hypothetical protein
MGWSPMHISVAILGLQCLVALFFIPYMDEGIAYCMCFFYIGVMDYVVVMGDALLCYT